MALNYTAYISGNQCIGDSRYTINSNFSSLDTSVYFLSTGFNQLTSYKVNTLETIVTIVKANSATWEESAEIIPTVTSYLSTNLIAMSSVKATGTFVIDTNSLSAALRVTQIGSGDALIVEDSTNPDSTPFRIDSLGRVVIGSQSSIYGGKHELYSDTTNQPWIVFKKYANDVDGSYFTFIKTRGSTPDSNTTVSQNDILGNIVFQGTDNNSNRVAAVITSEVDGVPVPSLSSVPGRLVFETTLSGSNTVSERMRITHDGKVGIGTTAPNELLTIAGNINAQNISVTNVTAVNLIGVPLSSLRDVSLNLPVLSGDVLRHNGVNWYNEKGTTDVLDGVRNDITVTNSGSVWTIVPEAVTYNKLSNLSTPASASVRARVAKAWLNYNGVTNTIRSSYNISSVTDLGTGYFRVNYVTDTFNDSNYSFIATCDETSSGGTIGYYVWSQPLNFNTNYTEVKHHTYAIGASETDPTTLSVVVFASGN